MSFFENRPRPIIFGLVNNVAPDKGADLTDVLTQRALTVVYIPWHWDTTVP
jgi:hypothetical protein